MEHKHLKTALVTGADTGLGKAIAKTLANEGFKVVLTGRREEKLREVENEIGKQYAIVIPADVTNEKDVQNLNQQIKEKAGSLDLLVNNVGGVTAMGSTEELSLDSWKQMIDVNLTSQFLVTKAFLPELRKSKGDIISVTSGMAHFFMSGFGPYSASKAGVEAYMKTVAEEEKDNGIKVHLFDPENVISETNPQGKKDPMDMMGKFKQLL